jgi:hypothetical protein
MEIWSLGKADQARTVESFAIKPGPSLASNYQPASDHFQSPMTSTMGDFAPVDQFVNR